MQFVNIYGLIFVFIMMIPNIIFAMNCKVNDLWKNKLVETLEQFGRFGCFGFMILKVPFLCAGFCTNKIFLTYLILNSVLTFAYCLIWLLCFRKNSIFKALSLSILPSLIFLFSGILSRYILLIIAAVIFAPCHVLISYKNTILNNQKNR